MSTFMSAEAKWLLKRSNQASRLNQYPCTLLLLLTFLVLLTAACGSSGSDESIRNPELASRSDSKDVSTVIPISNSMKYAAAENKAQKWLSVDLQIDVRSLILKSIELVDWPDTSLGCPEPGRVYAKVITVGHRMIFEFSGTIYEVHTDLNGAEVVQCKSPLPPT